MMMRSVLVNMVMAGASATARAEMSPGQAKYNLGDDMSSSWYRDEQTNGWVVADSAFSNGVAKCAEDIAVLDKANTPGDTKVSVRNPTPDFPAGDIALDDLRATCDRTTRAGIVKRWEKWAIEAMRDHAKVGTAAPVNQSYFQNCLDVYDQMLRSGIAKDTHVGERMVNDNDSNRVKWSGTVEELRNKWCDAGLKKFKVEQDKRDAPYKKVLKADKLAMALVDRGYFLTGGRSSDDPTKLAAENVWFTDTEPSEYCPNGAQVHVLHRYEFTAAHKLLRTTDSRSCGTPRASLFK